MIRSPARRNAMVLQHRGHSQKYWKRRNVPSCSKPFSRPGLGAPEPGSIEKIAPSCRCKNLAAHEGLAHLASIVRSVREHDPAKS